MLGGEGGGEGVKGEGLERFLRVFKALERFGWCGFESLGEFEEA